MRAILIYEVNQGLYQQKPNGRLMRHAKSITRSFSIYIYIYVNTNTNNNLTILTLFDR